MNSTLPPFLLMMLGLLALLAAARLCGWVSVQLKQPSILGELFAGILLGPTFLEKFSPSVSAFFRGSSDPRSFSLIIQFSLLLFLFGAGAEVSLNQAKKFWRTSLVVSLSGWVLPFLLGLAIFTGIREWVFAILAGEATREDFWRLSLFFATALSISAVPVIAKTLMDLGLYRSRMGMITMSAAVLTDVLAWFVFALIGGGLGHGAFALVSFVAGVGVRFANVKLIPTVWIEKFATLARLWFAPVFFASVGLKVDFIEHFNLAVVALVLAVACAGKILGCGLAAKFSGLESNEAWAVGFAMNARGAMEVILGIAALEALLISPVFFVALVIMAFATSMMSGPIISRLERNFIK